jgi:hypothetical protein
MGSGVMVLGIDSEGLASCSSTEALLYRAVGGGYWLFRIICCFSGGVSFYLIDDRAFSVLFGAFLYLFLFGALYRMVLLSVRRPPRLFERSRFVRMLPDLGSLIRLVVPGVLVFVLSLPIAGALQSEIVDSVSRRKRLELEALSETPESKSTLHSHYPVAVYSELLRSEHTWFVLSSVFLLVFGPILLLLVLKHHSGFTFQDKVNSEVEGHAIAQQVRFESDREVLLKRFGVTVVAPHCAEFEDFPVNAKRRRLLNPVVSNDAELLKVLWSEIK